MVKRMLQTSVQEPQTSLFFTCNSGHAFAKAVPERTQGTNGSAGARPSLDRYLKDKQEFFEIKGRRAGPRQVALLQWFTCTSRGGIVAEVNRELLLSGILRGVEVAVAGGLLSEGEGLHTEAFLPQAQELATKLVAQEPDGEMPPWRQMIVGEMVGTTVAARTMEGTMLELSIERFTDVLHDLWRIIDRW